MKRDAERITDQLFYTLLLRNADPALSQSGGARLMCGIIAGALADADWVPGPRPASTEGQRRWWQRARERFEAREYLTETGGMLDYHAGLVGLDPQFVREQVAVIRKWAQSKEKRDELRTGTEAVAKSYPAARAVGSRTGGRGDEAQAMAEV